MLKLPGRVFIARSIAQVLRMKKTTLAAAAFLTVAFSPAQADETGLASIHDWRAEGGRTCMSDHFHDGSGNGATRKAAEAAAVSSWVSFTVLEYGSHWGSYALAGSKKMDCSETGASAWSCSVTARPCKPGGARIHQVRKTKGRSRTQYRAGTAAKRN
jgi:hypothetical protein